MHAKSAYDTIKKIDLEFGIKNALDISIMEPSKLLHKDTQVEKKMSMEHEGKILSRVYLMSHQLIQMFTQKLPSPHNSFG